MLVFIKPGTGVHDQQIPGASPSESEDKVPEDFEMSINSGKGQEAFFPSQPP